MKAFVDPFIQKNQLDPSCCSLQILNELGSVLFCNWWWWSWWRYSPDFIGSVQFIIHFLSSRDYKDSRILPISMVKIKVRHLIHLLPISDLQATHLITVGTRSFTQDFLALKHFLFSSDVLSLSIYRKFSFTSGSLNTLLLIFQSFTQVDIFPILQIRTLKFRKLKVSQS